ncbi:MAG: BCCT family transporter, partial [Pseudomonadota bacterium]
HNFGTPNSVAGPISLLIGRPVPRRIGEILDAAVLVSLILGMAASLGAGMLLLSGGIGKLSGLTTTPLVLAGIALSIIVIVLISSVSGLLRGIRLLSDVNTRFFFAFVAFVFVFGPTLDILSGAGRAISGYIVEFVPRSTLIGDGVSRSWVNDWTVFYWANWLAWAPVTAMFLGRIARGYTVRDFIVMNLFIPAAFSMGWMSVFGGFAMSTDRAMEGGLKSVLETAGPEGVAFEAIATLPLGTVLIIVLLGLSFISYVTAADSNTEAIRMICVGKSPEMVDVATSEDTLAGGAALKIIWMALLGFCAWVMTAWSGIDGVRMLSNLGGLPALFIVSALALTLIQFSRGEGLRQLQSAPAGHPYKTSATDAAITADAD